jgi:predicted alpha/beta-fold hydrolase
MQFVETTTEDDLILQGIIAEPKKKTKSAVLHIHGMAGNFWENDFIKTMISDYPANGHTFLTVETRGSETSKMVFTKKEK